MIKKTGFLIAMATALSLTACGSQRAENAQLKQQVKQLEQQVADLQNQPQAQSTDNAAQPGAGNASPSAAADQAQPQDGTNQNTPAPSAPDENASGNYGHHEEHGHYDIGSLDASSLASFIQDLAQRVGDSTPTGSVQDQQRQFYDFIGEIDLAEKDLEILEDNLEAQYKAGNLSRADYQARNLKLDALEDQLDACEDRLEYIFHMED